MSDGITEENKTTEEQGTTEEEKKFVERKAYEQVAADMHKYKNQTKDALAKVAEYEAKEAQAKQQELIDQKKFQEIADNERKEKEQLKQSLAQLENKVLNAQRIEALRAEGIEFQSPEVFKLIQEDLEKIGFDDNSNVKKAEVKTFANKLRESLSWAIKQPKAADIPSDAPGKGSVAGKLNYEQWSKLSSADKKARMKDLDTSTIK